MDVRPPPRIAPGEHRPERHGAGRVGRLDTALVVHILEARRVQRVVPLPIAVPDVYRNTGLGVTGGAVAHGQPNGQGYARRGGGRGAETVTDVGPDDAGVVEHVDAVGAVSREWATRLVRHLRDPPGTGGGRRRRRVGGSGGASARRRRVRRTPTPGYQHARTQCAEQTECAATRQKGLEVVHQAPILLVDDLACSVGPGAVWWCPAHAGHPSPRGMVRPTLPRGGCDAHLPDLYASCGTVRSPSCHPGRCGSCR